MFLGNNVRDVLSLSLGVISVISWSVAEIPQIITNYNKKSTEGLSIAFLTTWMIGDIFNVIGCLMEPATLPTQFYMALMYTFATTLLYVQSIYYGYIYPRFQSQLQEPLLVPKDSKHRPSTKYVVVLALLFLGIFSLHRKILQVISGKIGMLLGWGMAAIYLGGRLPQIYLNFRRGHVDGLNPLMFFFALLGNLTYVVSILVNSLDWFKIAPNLPWLVDAGGCVLLDFLILLQFFHFKRKDTDNNKTETGEDIV